MSANEALKSQKSGKFSFRTSEELAMQIEDFCRKKGISSSEFFREAAQMKIVHSDLISMIRGNISDSFRAHEAGIDF